ncbi:MAG TPA: methyltransferase domain-containing protein [Candidatus Binatia bacterium]
MRAAEPSPAGGLVRTPRRPRGFVARGPRPARWDDPALAPRAGEDLCFLAGDWRILQRLDGHRWSLDDLVTAWRAASARADAPPARFIDLGCGIGSVLMLLAWRFPHARGVGVEAQQLSVDLARRSLAGNGADDRVEVRHGDLRDPTLVPEGAVFDLVTGTPPYVPPGAGRVSPRPQRGPCRIEQRGGIEDYCRAAARLLAPGGVFVACAGGAQTPRVAAAAHAAGLCLTESRDVVPRAGKPPLLAVHVMRRRDDAVLDADGSANADAGKDADGASAGSVRHAPPLVVRAADGRWTEEFAALRRDMGMP